MEFGGTYLIFANRERVWRALNDAEVLKKAIPRCEHISWNSTTSLDLVIKVNLGVMKPKFSGELELSNVIDAKKYTLSGRGHGGILGLARGSADIELKDKAVSKSDIADLMDDGFETDLVGGDAATLLSFSAHGGASKTIMAMGKSIIGKSAQGIIDRFMDRFSEAMDAPNLPKNHDDQH